MSPKLVILSLATVMMTGCATVDLNDMASNTPDAEARKADTNVVQKAVAKLHAAFSNHGFVQTDSRKKMQKAAKILLKGLEEKDLTSSADAESYANRVHTREKILSDITLATHHIGQTTKAAEIYLAMAADESGLRDELGSLEKALLMSNEARNAFENALLNTGGVMDASKWEAFETAVENLNAVTDKFGEQVRSSQSVKVSQIF